MTDLKEAVRNRIMESLKERSDEGVVLESTYSDLENSLMKVSSKVSVSLHARNRNIAYVSFDDSQIDQREVENAVVNSGWEVFRRKKSSGGKQNVRLTVQVQGT